MLRRKLLIRIGLLIAAFVVGAVVAIGLLQDVLRRIDNTNQDAAVLADGIQALDSAVTGIQAQPGTGVQDAASGVVADPRLRLKGAMTSLGEHPAARAPAGVAAPAYERLRGLLPAFMQAADAGGSVSAADAAGVRAAVDDLGASLRTHVAAEQTSLGRYFRALVLGLTLAALVMVNVAVFVLLRTAQVVLKPVGALVAGSRELAAEHFDHRVQVDQQDEFGELARAYNRLAEQLQANEERKAETLRQLAVTLNHDLNNAMAVIEMQLGLLGRPADGTQGQRLRDIRATLSRMSSTVASLKNIRRVVLTDYAPGQKMLDLERSVAPAPVSSGEHAA